MSSLVSLVVHMNMLVISMTMRCTKVERVAKKKAFGGFPKGSDSESLAVPVVGRANTHEAFVDSDARSIVSWTAALIDACDVCHTVRIFARR